MSYSTLRDSVEESNAISDFIESGKFKEYFVKNILLDDVLDYDSELDSELDIHEKKSKRTYKPPGRSQIADYFIETQWGRLIKDESTKDPTSSNGKHFRLRFRVPFPVFEELLLVTKEFNLFGYSREKRILIPEELSLMGVLRILGRGECYDTIEELSGISRSTIQRLFKSWTKNFVLLRNKYMGIPTDEEIIEIMKVYETLGLPGAVG